MLAPLMALRSDVQSITSRTDRLIQAPIWPPIRPVLRAALTTVIPTRAAQPRPRLA
jgi:hypothetical protein